ncbi:MFS transporter [Paucihalobacter sp.]|uniref:MFS transporter n=1 Tax=Paucihalobacter sp. TaxID=2850405 RepID=UPI002FE367BF
MEEVKTATLQAQAKVPLVQKIAFGSGHLVNNLLPGALGVFSFFLITAFGINPALAGLLAAIPRLFDAISDPIMGFVTDNTNTRWGRRRPYIFIGAILCSILFAVQWQMFEENGATYNFWYFMTFSILFILSNTIFSTPLMGLGYELSSDTKERNNLMGLANTIGQISWMIVPLFWSLIANKDLFDSQADGVRTLSIFVGFICLIFGILPAIFSKEPPVASENQAELTYHSLAKNLRILGRDMLNMTKNTPFVRLCAATFLVFNGFQMVASFSFFIIVYYMFNGSYEAAGTVPPFFSIITAFLTATIIIPIVTWMANNFGKRKAFIYSTLLSMLGYVLKWWGFFEVDENTVILFKDVAITIGVVEFPLAMPLRLLLPIPFMAFGLGGLFTLMMSMTADVCDLDELENGLPRREGTFAAIYWWMVKIGQSIALALGGFVLSYVGFDGSKAFQTAETMHSLRVFDIVIPTLTAGLAALIMVRYSLNEDRVAEIKLELEAKRKTLNQKTPYAYRKNTLWSHSEFATFPDDKIPFISGLKINSLTAEELKIKFHEILKDKMKGICFSPYENRQKPGYYITEDQIRKRLATLQPHTEWIRMFSSIKGHENIPKIAKELGMKTISAAWINQDEESNEKEINNLIENINNGHVDIAVVGNETLYRNDLTEEELISYINQVKSAITMDVPVTTADVYYELLLRPELLKVCDVILANAYPFWEGYPIKLAGLQLQKSYNELKNMAPDKKVIISETGWPSDGGTIDDAEASEINAMKYFVDTQLWAKNNDIEVFHFSSFDEAWKVTEEGELGVNWGIWDSKGNLKF